MDANPGAPISAEPAQRVDEVRPGWRWMLGGLSLVLPALFFFRATFSSDVFLAGDTLRAFYPMRAYWASRVSRGEFPDWFPYDGFGQSFPAIFISGVFHPTTLLHLVLPLGVAVKLTVLLCFPVAFLGTAALLREWGVPRAGALFGALTFTFSGYLVCITNNPTYLLPASTVPAALWGVLRFVRRPTPARLTVGGGLLALVAFGGDAQAFAVTQALGVLMALAEPVTAPGTWARRLGACLLMVATGGLLAAPQLFPAAGLLLTGEPGARSVTEAQYFSLHPLRVGELLLGPFLTDPVGVRGIPEVAVRKLIFVGGFTRAWVDSLYVGTPACVLALAGLGASWRRGRTWVFVGAWLLLVLLVLGSALPVYGWVYQLLPLWRPFRYPEKLASFVVLGLAVGAGLGWRRCLGPGGSSRAVIVAGVGVAALCAAVALGEALGGVWTRGWVLPHWPDIPRAAREGLSGNVVRMGSMAAGLALACAVLAWRPRLGAGWLVLQGAALFLENAPLYQVSPVEILETPPPLVARIRALVPEGEPVRVNTVVKAYGAPPLAGYEFRDRLSLGQVAVLAPDTSVFWGIESAASYLPGRSTRLLRLMADSRRWAGELAPRLSTPYSVVRTEELRGAGPPPGGRVVAEDPLFGLSLMAHAQAPARIHLARPECVASLDEALRRMLAPELFAPGDAIVECAAPLEAGAGTGSVRVTRESPERFTVEVAADGPSVLVINDAYQPGWSATLDGAPVPILPANVAVRAVAVPTGSHTVMLRYRTPGLLPGLWVGALTLGALAVAMGVTRRRAGKGSAVPSGVSG
ncbi:YfhO family protein [Corallococcus sp. Z5C101001]|uniref:YfhO family protein n=1 Tax=Corallococcus sp. Z5C101001 TaxID=2596829 RepID=UPI00117F31C9|nr:YfhO family protein [Corallococcus sp. Z5C101001]TSC33590.1 YfhO family protein [Corallococcus sp. Z5C101001]